MAEDLGGKMAEDLGSKTAEDLGGKTTTIFCLLFSSAIPTFAFQQLLLLCLLLFIFYLRSF